MKLKSNGIHLVFVAGLLTLSIGAASIFITQSIMNRLLVNDARTDGMGWAQSVADQTSNLEALLDGSPSLSLTDRILGRLSAVGNIYSFEFIAPDGTLMFKTGSFHPPSDGQDAAHHAHSHPKPVPVATTSMMPVDSHSNESHADSHDHSAHAHGDEARVDAPNLMGDHAVHKVKLILGNGYSDPLHFAEVTHPIIEDGELRYSIRVRIDQTERFELYQAAVWQITGVLAITVLLVVGIPAFLQLRSRKQAALADRRAHYLAQHDPMTGLANRLNFLDKLETACAELDNNEEIIALLSIDVDYFKEINDGYGHDVGDELLVQFAAQLKYECESFDSIARIGGDEFAAFCRFDARKNADDFVMELQRSLSHPYEVKGHNMIATASIGAAYYPALAHDVTDLMKKSDIALYAAKTEGRNCAAVFAEHMEKEIAERRDLEALLRRAVHNSDFELYFQPLYSQQDLKACGFEALMRLRDQDGQFVPPERFIPVAEEMGIMDELGFQILKKGTMAALNWPAPMRLAINLSAAQFESGKLVQHVKDALAESGLPAKLLELEITESLLMQNTQRNLKQLTALKKMGVSIAMDDFGTGYSSLGYLWQFPFDKIKIDRSFLGGDENSNAKAMQVISTIIALGHSLEMRVTAEGVETESQVAMLNKLKCDQLQGFYLGRPAPESELEKYWADDAGGHAREAI
ncbi:putative bifunctional diguanylate cyclase/phosphodiesterase [Maritalea mediterranea]|uniref:EAL domain-containing protein n=1 Tax=Maritalea mediterranea TaxID=2909667 RepID=A0ABS9E6C2_9HYPH|nr:EAL domain-containing protein [Maritalea mediterranea]MCF4096978.1 EAL domain-containing protein [Maritalea mediterranea]